MMESITITIETGNAAFDECPATEIARILRDLATRLEENGDPFWTNLYDANGNNCGRVEIRLGD